MGGKSKEQAPDPRLVEAQIRSLNIQDDSIQQLLGLQRELQPLQRSALEQGLESARIAQRESGEDRAWMLGRRAMLESAQNDIATEANQFNTDAKREELAGQAIADVNQSFDAVRGQQTRDLTRRGVAPGSGAALALDGQTRVSQALAQAEAGTLVRRQAREEGRALKGRVADMLAGYPGMASAQTGAGANYGTAGVGLTNTSAAGQMQPITVGAGIAGQMGSSATSMFGAQAQREAAARGAKAQERAGYASALGSLGGAAIGAFGSDRRLKTDIQPVGTHEATGLTLYHFRYRSDPGRVWRGVMADEAQKVMPGAVHEDRNGFLTVNYALLGIPFEEVRSAA